MKEYAITTDFTTGQNYVWDDDFAKWVKVEDFLFAGD